MTDSKADLWRRAKEILADALAIPPSGRAAFVEARCAGDAALCDDVFSLLKHAENATDFIERSPVIAAHGQPFAAPTLTGSHIGAYLIGEEIGRGGMGVVYAADRVDGAYEKRVAIKILRNSAHGESDARRMMRERQALAELNHPNIAHLLDGGTTTEGLPYLVMEYIDGESVDTYCAKNALGLNGRVELVRAICAAVQSAHQNLLIHRDIKPSNILVSSEGTPKLLDFGIARMLSTSAANASATQDTALLFTPRYASPEQVRGLPVSVATDVYGLGLLLYELLAGSSPYARIASDEATNAAAAMQVVLDDPPRKASEVAKQKMPSFSRELEGDLDVILLKACAKVPAERYATVAQLDDDLRRWLDDEPILARPPSWQYGLRKFVARHRSASVLAVVALAAVLVGGVSTLAQKRKAEARYAQVRELANSLIFKYYDKIESMPGSAPVRKELAADGIVFLDSLVDEAASDPTLAVEIAGGYRKLTNVLFNGRGLPHLGDKPAAEATAKKAYALLEPVLAKTPNHVAANKEMASLDTAMGALLTQEGRTKDAIGRMESAAVRYENALRADPADEHAAFEVTRTYISTAQAAITAGLPAEIYLDRGDAALKRWSVGRENDPELANISMFLVRTRFRIAFAAKDYPSAMKYVEEEIFGINKMLTRAGDTENYVLRGHLQGAWTYKGAILLETNRPTEALAAFMEARSLAQQIVDKDPDNINSRSRYARIYTHLGKAKLALNAPTEAAAAFSTSVDEYAKLRGKSQASYAYEQHAEALWRAGMTYAKLNDTKTATRHAAGLVALANLQPTPFGKKPGSDWLDDGKNILAGR